ncbi:MAG: T9SS type A sorting domain-containing protein, partial [Bacteroidia bacterium]|nr:T9SS type A sorting domain-containing protein [Bacteroidia bacterium]
FFIETNSEMTVYLYDVLGNIIFTKVLKEGNHDLNFENQSNGIYFLKVSRIDSSKTVRIIKN